MWIARDRDGELWLFRVKPKRVYWKEGKNSFSWSSNFQRYISELPHELFPDIKWEDEPVEVEIIVKKKTNIRKNIRNTPTVFVCKVDERG